VQDIVDLGDSISTGSERNLEISREVFEISRKSFGTEIGKSARELKTLVKDA
jgi:phosphoglycerate-specific signal transduction histidine kinase